MTTKTEQIAIALSIFAILVSIIGVGFIYLNQPQKVDLSGIDANRQLIISQQYDIQQLKTNINSMKTDISNSELSPIRLEEIENDIEEIQRDIRSIERCAEHVSYSSFRNCIDDRL